MLKDIIAQRVIEYYSQYPDLMHDDLIHTQEVVAYTRLIAIGEGLNEDQLSLMESAAWLHDIGCPRSKELYGNSLPENQQRVGREVAEELLQSVEDISTADAQWLVDVVASHHQFRSAQELGFSPLFEADLIVNLLSGYHPHEKAPLLFDSMIRSESGRKLFKVLIRD